MTSGSKMGAQVWSLISLGVGLNLLFGAMVALFKIPLYLDSFGTILVAALAGPTAGVLTGLCGVALLGVTSPTALAFMPVAGVVGLLSGWWARGGGFRGPLVAALGGALIGVVGAALAAPIATTLFGGVTGGGTDLLVAVFRAQGQSALLSAFWQGLAVDPLDKAMTCLAVLVVLRALPARALHCFALGAKLTRRGQPPPSPYRPLPTQLGPCEPVKSDAVQAKSLPQLFLPAQAMLKTAVLLSTLVLTGLLPDSRWQDAALILGGTVLLYGIAAPSATVRLLLRLTLALAPLGISLVIISGLLVPHESDSRFAGLGLSWSAVGLSEAAFFLTRAGLILWALSVYFASTPLPRVGEILFRLRIPYPVVFVVLTGADLTRQLKERFLAVAEAQQSRGLPPARGGLRARWRGLLQILVPTVSSVFLELPIRAAALQSRGLLQARPRARVPHSWLREPEPTLAGDGFQILLLAASWAGYLWL